MLVLILMREKLLFMMLDARSLKRFAFCSNLMKDFYFQEIVREGDAMRER